MSSSPPAPLRAISRWAVEGRVAREVVDDAAVGGALDVVDVDLVERPTVDPALEVVGLGVDRAAVEAKHLGDAVVLARGQPGDARGQQAGGRGGGQEGLDLGLHRLGGGQGVVVAGGDDLGILLAGGAGLRADIGVVPGRAGCVGRATEGEDKAESEGSCGRGRHENEHRQ
jgi:hypothetical protein